MFSKIAVLCGLVAACSAGLLGHGAVSSQSIVRHDHDQLAHRSSSGLDYISQGLDYSTQGLDASTQGLVKSEHGYGQGYASEGYAGHNLAYASASGVQDYSDYDSTSNGVGYAGFNLGYAAPAYSHAPAVSSHNVQYAPALSHGYAAPVVNSYEGAHHHTDSYAYPSYKYGYGVTDYHTGDQKSASEVREGDVVKGQYSLVEPDGSIRTVHYSADDHSGFQAVVHKTPGIHASKW